MGKFLQILPNFHVETLLDQIILFFASFWVKIIFLLSFATEKA